MATGCAYQHGGSLAIPGVALVMNRLEPVWDSLILDIVSRGHANASYPFWFKQGAEEGLSLIGPKICRQLHNEHGRALWDGKIVSPHTLFGAYLVGQCALSNPEEQGMDRFLRACLESTPVLILSSLWVWGWLPSKLRTHQHEQNLSRICRRVGIDTYWHSQRTQSIALAQHLSPECSALLLQCDTLDSPPLPHMFHSVAPVSLPLPILAADDLGSVAP